MESLLKDLKKHLECSICQENYKQPKTISCLHTFCCKCLEKHARDSHEKEKREKGKFQCPECQAQIDMPEDDRFDSLPNSFFHNSLLSLLAVRRAGDGNDMTCSQCGEDNSQMYYCFDCGRFMCPECNNAHERLRASFEGHKVKSVKEFEEEDYEALLKRQPFCSKRFHEKEITRFFCSSCNDCVCQNCIATDHQSHKITLLDQAAHDERPNILEGAKIINEKVEELSGVILKFEETTTELKNNFEIAKGEVSEAAKRMIEKIQVLERVAVSSLDKTLKKRQEKITSAEKDAKSLIKQMKQAVEFANNLAERSSTSDIMSNKDTLKKRNEQLHRVEIPKHHKISTFIKFSAASVEVLKLGDIQTTEPRADENQYVPAAAQAEGQWPCRLV